MGAPVVSIMAGYWRVPPSGMRTLCTGEIASSHLNASGSSGEP
jgi:hypothetical protein